VESKCVCATCRNAGLTGIEVDHPMLVMIIGSIGFALNVVSVTFLHGEWPFHALDTQDRLR
jgi:hypothetical protein